jgi:hypothetical protein
MSAFMHLLYVFVIMERASLYPTFSVFPSG